MIAQVGLVTASMNHITKKGILDNGERMVAVNRILFGIDRPVVSNTCLCEES